MATIFFLEPGICVSSLLFSSTSSIFFFPKLAHFLLSSSPPSHLAAAGQAVRRRCKSASLSNQLKFHHCCPLLHFTTLQIYPDLLPFVSRFPAATFFLPSSPANLVLHSWCPVSFFLSNHTNPQNSLAHLLILHSSQPSPLLKSTAKTPRRRPLSGRYSTPTIAGRHAPFFTVGRAKFSTRSNRATIPPSGRSPLAPPQILQPLLSSSRGAALLPHPGAPPLPPVGSDATDLFSALASSSSAVGCTPLLPLLGYSSFKQQAPQILPASSTLLSGLTAPLPRSPARHISIRGLLFHSNTPFPPLPQQSLLQFILSSKQSRCPSSSPPQ